MSTKHALREDLPVQLAQLEQVTLPSLCTPSNWNDVVTSRKRSCGKVTFNVDSRVCPSFSPQGGELGGSYVSITQDALDFSVHGPPTLAPFRKWDLTVQEPPSLPPAHLHSDIW